MLTVPVGAGAVLSYVKTKGASTMGNTFDFKLNHKLGGVSSISGTLSSVSGAFPTFAIQFIVFPL